MDRIMCMEAFVRVAEARSFTEAARRWGRSKAVVSKYVAQLETRLGVTLLHRSTRSVALTDAGRAYYENSLQVLSLLEESETQLRAGHVSLDGTLRVTAPPGLLSMERRSLLVSFMQKFPNVALDIDVTHRTVDLVEERVDVAIRVTRPEDSSLIARRLAPVPIVLVASPGYLATKPAPTATEELADHRCILDQSFRFHQQWPFLVGGRRFSVEAKGTVFVNDPLIVRDLAREGLGVAMIPRLLVREDLAAGDLQEVLPGAIDLAWSVYAVTSQQRHLPGRARAFIDHLRRTLPATFGTD